MGEDSIVRYFFEAGMLKRISRSGWWAEGIKNPESVADHSFRTAIIAFALAKMEGLSPERLCAAAVFHDMHEARLGDMNKITARYVHTTRELERKIEREQAGSLPAGMKKALAAVLELSETERTILKDADYLECAIQAREYADAGNSGTPAWVGIIGKRLKTKSAKRLHAGLRAMKPNSWWSGLKRLE